MIAASSGETAQRFHLKEKKRKGGGGFILQEVSICSYQMISHSGEDFANSM